MNNIHILPTEKPSRLISSGKYFNLLGKATTDKRCKNIYITSDEEIKEGYAYYPELNEVLLFDNMEGEVYEQGRQLKVILTTDPPLIADGVQAIPNEFLEWFVKNPNCEEVKVVLEDVEQPKPLYPNGKHKGERVWIEQYIIIIPKEEPLTKLQIAKNIAAIGIGKKEEPKQEYICYKCQNKTNNKFEICDKCNVGWKNPKQETTLEEAAKRIYGSDASKDVEYYAFILGAKWQQERSYSEEDMYWAMNMAKGFTDSGKSDVDIRNHFEQFKKK